MSRIAPFMTKSINPRICKQALPLLPLCPSQSRHHCAHQMPRILIHILVQLYLYSGYMLWRIRAARLNMQITKCFIGNGLELRAPPPIWAPTPCCPTSHPFTPEAIYSIYSIQYIVYYIWAPTPSPFHPWQYILCILSLYSNIYFAYSAAASIFYQVFT